MRSIFVREKPKYGRGIAIAAAVIAGIAAVFFLGVYLVGLLPQAVEPTAVDESAESVPLVDQERLDHVVFAEEFPRLAIPEASAIGASTHDFDPDELGATRVDAYLATITIPSTERASTKVIDRDVWIVKLSGMAVPRSGSVATNPDGSETLTFSTVFIYVDALTGDVLYGEWYE